MKNYFHMPLKAVIFILFFFAFSIITLNADDRYEQFRKAMNLATKNYQQKNYETTLANLSRAMVLSSGSEQKAWVFSMQFSVLMQTKKYEEAVSAMEKASKSIFLVPAARNQFTINEINALYQLKKYPEAIKVCDKLIITTTPHKKESAYDYKCQIYYTLKEYGKMLDAADKMIAFSSRLPDAHIYIRAKNHLMTALIGTGEYAKAMTVFSEGDYGKMNNPEKFNYYIRMADLNLKQKDFPAADAMLGNAYKVLGISDEQKNQALLTKAHTLAQSEKTNEAIAICEKLIVSRATNKRDEAYNLECQLYSKQKMYDKMLDTAVKQALVAIPDSWMYYQGKKNQIRALVAMENYAKAMDVFSEADVVRMSADMKSEYYNSIGGIYRAQKDYVAAAEAYAKSGLASDSPAATSGIFNGAEMYLLANNNNEALKLYDKIVNNPDAKPTDKVIAIFKSADLLNKMGNHSEALAMVAKIENIQNPAKFYWASAKLLAAQILAERGNTKDAKVACNAAMHSLDSIISSPDASKYEVNMALDKFTECDFSSMEKPDTGTFAVKEGDFVLPTEFQDNENLLISYMVPVDEQGNPLPSAHNVVFYAPFLGDNMPLRKPQLRYFAQKLGFTIFTMNNKCDRDVVGDKQKYYIFNESGWHDIVWKAHQKLLADFKLEPRKLLVVGESAGGSMAQLLAVHYSDKIDAVAMIGGHYFEAINKDSKIAWLTLNTWGCPNTQDAIQLKTQAKTQNIQVLRGETPFVLKSKDGGFSHHAASDFAWKLMQTFIKTMVVLRDKNHGAIPAVELWPITMTIDREKQYLPSEEFAALWKQLPHEATASFENETDSEQPLIVSPPSGRTKRIVFFVHDPSLYESTHLMDNLYFIAKKNNIAVSAEISDNQFKSLEKVRKTIAFILENEQWKTMPVYVLGSGVGGRLAAVAALANGSARIKQVTTFNSEYIFPINELSISAYRNKSQIPLMMLASDDSYLPSRKIRDTDSILVENGGESLGKWWFYILSKCSE